MERLRRYISDIKSGRVKSGEWTKLAVARFERDLERSKTDPAFPYRFSVKKAWQFISFTENLKQYKDQWRGKPIHLEPWQVFVLGNIYGWINKETGLRRFRKAFIFVGRKNGKSTMVSSCLLYDALFTAGGEAYAAATKRDQSRIILDNCVEMIKQDKALSEQFQYYRSSKVLVNDEMASKIVALSRETDKMDGLNPSVVVCDEVAAMKDYSMIKVLSSGQYSRPEPLLIEITSGSDDTNSAGAQEAEASRQILAGSVEDDTFFTVLYTLDDGDDWKDPTCWIKANPNLGVTVFQDKLEHARDEALIKPEMEAEFRVKNCCSFISPVTAWISEKAWAKARENARGDKPDFSKCLCIGAIDLSMRVDFTVFTLCFYDIKTGLRWLEHKIYIPEEQIEVKNGKDSPLIKDWIAKGYIKATVGASVDYNVMFDDVKEALAKYNIKEILFDPWNSGSLQTEIGSLCDLVEIKQSIKSISPMAKDFEALVYDAKIADDNPVMAWMLSNTEIYKDPNGNIKPQKRGGKNSRKHIDAVITSLMAVGRLKQLEDNGELDTRTAEEIQRDMEKAFSDIDY